MLFFASDYLEGAHPAILDALARTNLVPQPGYGEDAYCRCAADKIRAACHAPDADVFFISGGTQTNRIVISALLDTVEGVLSPMTGHINGHEGGAIESTGHKVLALPHRAGKLDADTVRAYLADFYADADGYPHMVQPGMLYLTHPTEYGTLYTKAELTALRQVADEYGIPVFLDGARLGYALATPSSDVNLEDLARLTDCFYIGGTKVGALLGEAVVFPRGNAPKYFFTHIKQQGALLAKGRVLGLQFDALFTDGLYQKIAQGAVRQADRIRAALTELGISEAVPSPTNQVFPVLANEEAAALAEEVVYTFWEKADEGHSVIRLCTSWATTDEGTDALIAVLRRVLGGR